MSNIVQERLKKEVNIDENIKRIDMALAFKDELNKCTEEEIYLNKILARAKERTRKAQEEHEKYWVEGL